MESMFSDLSAWFILISRFAFYLFVLIVPIYSLCRLISAIRKKEKRNIVSKSIAFLLVVVISVCGFVSPTSLPTKIKKSNLQKAADMFSQLEPGPYVFNMLFCDGDVYIQQYESSDKAKKALMEESYNNDAEIKNYEGIEYIKTPYYISRWQRGAFFRGDIVTGIIDGAGGEMYIVSDNKLICIEYRYFQDVVGTNLRGIFTLDMLIRPRLNLVRVAKHLEKDTESEYYRYYYGSD